jgi:acetyl-CoA carboxylase carboxyl transferase subunit alpha
MSSPYEKVLMARRAARPGALAYIEALCEDFVEFHGDRCFGDDKAVVGGLARLDGRAVTVVGIQKGRTLEENMARNFGSPHPEGYRKALRLMRQAEKFRRPILHFINTSGAFCGPEAEERGQGAAIAQNLLEMATLRCPILSVIIGEGGSGGALALALADRVWMLENSVYSVLSPEGFASILWKDAARAPEAAALMGVTAQNLLAMGVIDKVIPEPEGGAENDFPALAARLKEEVSQTLAEISALDPDTLLRQRYQRFRKFGAFLEE